ncbi:DegT/DnrJ/EryC1/StrS family aminotransferase [Hufsiella ginkgonis]|uniref:DegT/DnrJ/EryC1/StrS family aminotransferase n=1 Tax=Hufsiella ginkgonis TaxID=2695274 RepID=A0A7K1Y090_9SPHI|nr:DegT/DnrJ/EryC1/StrS family aminotransferase [Hufsiella ginkgonis]MXV16691.1 DegT/DnrJ/EryC1/StrS family aminotransferase [Hufsiella ginkgonis]
MINVTKTFLPPFEQYTETLKRAWDKSWITNNGELVLELEQKLKDYLDARNFILCVNGTVVLQMAIKALNLTGEIITTPFSYVATTTTILWANCTPVFVDIDPGTFCIDATKIEAAITPRTQAIMATHVYGYPCDVEAIEALASKYGLKVIYDAAHAFGTKINGTSLLNYGDVSTCSFHATKVFHMGEGGCIVSNDDKLSRQMYLYRQFGHIGEEYFTIGINGKASELHAAMGLCNLEYVGEILAKRKEKWLFYYEMLKGSDVQLLTISSHVDYNYAYFPVVFKTEAALLKVIAALKDQEIFPRRYFYPSLNLLDYVEYQSCPVAESIARNVLCLPLYFDLLETEQLQITGILLHELKEPALCN